MSSRRDPEFASLTRMSLVASNGLNEARSRPLDDMIDDIEYASSSDGCFCR